MAVHEKFFTSDTHFFHANILKFTDDAGNRIRPFDGVEEMHEYMIEKWNSVVGDNDYVYHLGDVTFRYDGGFNNLMTRLKGKKRLIVGNHDKIWNPALQLHFEKVDIWKGFSNKGDEGRGGFTASHFKLRLETLRDGTCNVHGHTHQNIDPDKHYINVCGEVRDYTPVHMDQILLEIKNA